MYRAHGRKPSGVRPHSAKQVPHGDIFLCAFGTTLCGARCLQRYVMAPMVLWLSAIFDFSAFDRHLIEVFTVTCFATLLASVRAWEAAHQGQGRRTGRLSDRASNMEWTTHDSLHRPFMIGNSKMNFGF